MEGGRGPVWSRSILQQPMKLKTVLFLEAGVASAAVEEGEAPGPDDVPAPVITRSVWSRITATWTAASDWLAATAVVRAVLRLNRAAQHRVDELEKLPQSWLRSAEYAFHLSLAFLWSHSCRSRLSC